MKKIVTSGHLTVLAILLLFTGCKKYLEAKPDKKLVVPSSLADLQALLDNNNKLNENDPTVVGEASSDNYYLSDVDWAGIQENYRRMYLWEKDRLFTPYPNQWSYAYDKIYITNVVLDNLKNIERTESNQKDWDNIKGQALCFRAKTFLDIAIVWSLAYDKTGNDLGIPLRLTSDFNEASQRPSVKQTYDQVINDLKESQLLLPAMPKSVLRPSKTAALALLARTYLSMREYDSAYVYADLCLQLKNDLMDYNNDPQVNTAATYPFAQFNKEVIMESRSPVISPLDNSKAKMDSLLVASYNVNDLRRSLFFKNSNGTFSFRGSYENGAPLFTSVAVDEIFLIRAECAARKGMTAQALNDLNALMVKRWSNAVAFPSFSAPTPAEALKLILAERRKELVMRGLRWMDIKRLNKENAGINLKRISGGKEYTLPANDLRCALPIPEDAIQRSGMQQNPR
jgi:starch-binding outer membrane protein, SusD/RagB family